MTAFGKQPVKVFVKVSDWALHGSAVTLLLTEKRNLQHSKKSGNTICPLLTAGIIQLIPFIPLLQLYLFRWFTKSKLLLNKVLLLQTLELWGEKERKFAK